MRAWIAVVLMASMALAGCASEGTAKDVEDVESVPATKPTTAISVGVREGELRGNLTGLLLPLEEIPVADLRYLGVSTFEPTVGADADGCLYYTHFRGTGTGTRIYTSCDQGLTWSDIGPDLPGGAGPCFPNSNDPFVHVDRDTGRVFSSDLHALVTSTLHFTDDKGDSWTCNVLGGGLPPGVHDHQSIATGAPRTVTTVGYPNVVYYCVNRVADSWCATSLNGGMGFGPAITVFPGAAARAPTGTNPLENFCGGLTGHVETDHAGRAYWGRSFCNEVHVAVTEDDGLTWNPVVVSRTTGIQAHEVRIAADAENNVYAFWVGADWTPYVSVSTDHGKSWGTPFSVAPEGMTGAGRPAIAAGADGSVVVAYIGIEHENGRDTPTEAMEWFAYMGIIYDATSDNPTVFTVKAKEDAIDYGRNCASVRCGGIGDFIDVTVDDEGRPWAAFGDQCLEGCDDDNGPTGAHAFVGTLSQGRSLVTGLPLPPLAEASIESV